MIAPEWVEAEEEIAVQSMMEEERRDAVCDGSEAMALIDGTPVETETQGPDGTPQVPPTKRSLNTVEIDHLRPLRAHQVQQLTSASGIDADSRRVPVSMRPVKAQLGNASSHACSWSGRHEAPPMPCR
jgi:hypothetical protein